MLSIEFTPERDSYNSYPITDSIKFSFYEDIIQLVLKDNDYEKSDREVELSKEDAIKLARTILFSFGEK